MRAFKCPVHVFLRNRMRGILCTIFQFAICSSHCFIYPLSSFLRNACLFTVTPSYPLQLKCLSSSRPNHVEPTTRALDIFNGLVKLNSKLTEWKKYIVCLNRNINYDLISVVERHLMNTLITMTRWIIL